MLCVGMTHVFGCLNRSKRVSQQVSKGATLCKVTIFIEVFYMIVNH